MKLIIYMFALNERDNTQHVISSLPKALDKIDFIECLVIDDGSADNTAALTQSCGAEVVMHGRNLGHYAFTGTFTPYKSFGFIGLGF